MLAKALLLGTTLLAAACQTTNPAATAPAASVAAAPPSALPASALPASALPGAPVGGGSEKLYAHRWALTEAAGQPVASPDDARAAHLLFFPLNRLSGSTGCNRLAGTFELMGEDRVKFSPLATTRMMCPEPAAATETRFLQALAAGQTYRVSDETLELRNGPSVVARFRAAPASLEK